MCRVKEGTVRAGMQIRSMATGREFDGDGGRRIYATALKPTVMSFRPVRSVIFPLRSKAYPKPRWEIPSRDADNPAAEPLPGYKQANPMVFCGIYPADGADYADRCAMRWIS